MKLLFLKNKFGAGRDRGKSLAHPRLFFRVMGWGLKNTMSALLIAGMVALNAQEFLNLDPGPGQGSDKTQKGMICIFPVSRSRRLLYPYGRFSLGKLLASELTAYTHYTKPSRSPTKI